MSSEEDDFFDALAQGIEQKKTKKAAPKKEKKPKKTKRPFVGQRKRDKMDFKVPSMEQLDAMLPSQVKKQIQKSLKVIIPLEFKRTKRDRK